MGQQDAMNKRAIIKALSQRSTIVGIVGICAGVMSLIGMPMSAETELKMVEGVLLLVSLVAIMTREEEPYRGIDRRVNRGTGGGSGGVGGDNKSADTVEYKS